MRAKRILEFRVVLLLLAMMVVSGGFLISCGLSGKSVRCVILISIDTCRADHLSCYGYPRTITPNIDELAMESMLFTSAYSPVPMTQPAHASMLTGTIPPVHGVHDNYDYQLSQSNVTLAEILGQSGYTTAAVISSFVLDSQFGLDQGFGYYHDQFEQPISPAEDDQRRGGETTRIALEWLDEHADEKFFMFIHYYDPHTLYVPPEPFASRFIESPYAGEIAYTDFCIAQVIAKLKELELYDSSLLIVVGDHGEMLGEHDEQEHEYFIYESAIKVPLIFKLPGRSEPKTIDQSVGIIDIVPTVCELLGVETPPNIQGEDLLPYFETDSPDAQDREVYCESLYPTRYGANSLLGVVDGRWKYIQTTRPELYDLIEDPGETNNLVVQESERARALQDKLRTMLEESIPVHGSDSKVSLDEEARARLESLGYLGGASVSEDFEFDQSKEDPKSLIGYHNLKREAGNLVVEERFEEASEVCEQMLRERPQAFDTHYWLARIAKAENDNAAVVRHLSEAIRLRPDETKTRYELGVTLLEMNEIDAAMTHLNEALRIMPWSAELHNNVGIALAKKRRLAEAIEHFSEALRISPEFAVARSNLERAKMLQGKQQ